MQPKSFTAVPCKGERKQAKKRKFSSEKHDKKDVQEKIALVSKISVEDPEYLASYLKKTRTDNDRSYTFRIIENNKFLLYV